MILLLGIPGVGIKLVSDKEQVIERDETIVLKALAVLIVLISHYYRYTKHVGVETLLVSSGYLGASIFCVLSAYGCTKSFFSKGFVKGYFTNKIKHVYIPFVIVNILTLSLNCESYTVLECIIYFLGIKLLNGIYWFVPFILGFYLLFWFIYSRITRYKKRIFMMLLVSVIYIFLCIWGQVEEQWYSSALCIVLGCYVAENEKTICSKELKNIIIISISYFLLFIFFIVINLCFRHIEIIKSISACLSAVLFCGCIMNVLCKLRFKRNQFYLWIGLSSYWIYLIHVNILYIFFIETSHFGSVLFVFCSILAGGAFYFIESKL
ncbi:MAG: acyltransferase [Lachnospiraceae bacterium]|nr:acyltransferase [Lachnospiraceae bacterium]